MAVKKRIIGNDRRRFLSKVAIVPGGCWRWMGNTSNGYGQFRIGAKLYKAHRWGYENLRGFVSKDLDLDHLCHNDTDCVGGVECLHRACVNPEHLEPVTHLINTRRGKGGQHFGKRTHCKHGHEYTKENTQFTSKGFRRCRECRRLENRGPKK